jgi:NDP-sugar pyrophosphorylase family protein
MIDVCSFIGEFQHFFPEHRNRPPWELTRLINAIVAAQLRALPPGFKRNGDVAIHPSATIEEHVILKGPLIISAGCFIAAHAYLRHGVFLDHHVSIGPGCEVKASFIFSHTTLAHFNFAGDSLLGSNVNLEAGAVIANHFNERQDKEIVAFHDHQKISTGVEKFGALIGDGTRIGANAVLSPGTVLPKGSIVRRLELVDQSESRLSAM